MAVSPDERSRTPVRRVQRLWNPVPVELSPATIAEYRSRQPFALALDRQSDPRELTLSQRTGQENRVRKIQQQAVLLQVYLPDPIETPDVVDGEYRYVFDPRYWFVDGIGRRATGFSSSPEARPELWRAHFTIETLAPHSVIPTWVIVGEGTRFFRDENWLTTWTRALWAHQLRLFVCGFGEITKATLSGLVSYVSAMSGWLIERRREARETRRRRGELFQVAVAFPLQGLPDRTGVTTHPEQWPVFHRIVRELADGTLPTLAAACRALPERLRDEDGQPFRMCRSRLREILFGPVPEGSYVCYSQNYTPRMVVEEYGLHRDLDITPGGNRRYVVDRGEGETFPIQFRDPADRIDGRTLLLARRRVAGRTGRPESQMRENIHTGEVSLLSRRLVKCIHCGYSVGEYPPIPRETKDRRARFDAGMDRILIERLAERQKHPRILAALQEYCLRTGREPPRDRDAVRGRRDLLGLTGEFEADLARLRAYWTDPFRPWPLSWRLRCVCQYELMRIEHLSGPDAERDPRCDHVRIRTGYLTSAALSAFFTAVVETPPLDGEGESQAALREKIALERERDQINEQLLRLSREIQAGLHGPTDDPDFARRIKAMRDPLDRRVQDLRVRLATLEKTSLQQRFAALEDEDLRHRIREIVPALQLWSGLKPEERRRGISPFAPPEMRQAEWERAYAFVHDQWENITIDLASGDFVITTRFHSESLKQIRGRVPDPPLPDVLRPERG